MNEPLATICIQTRGNRFERFRRCLTSILQHTPAGVFELRLGFIQASDSLHHALGMLNGGMPLERDVLPGRVERLSWNEGNSNVHCWNAPANLAKEAMTRLLYCDVPPASDYLVSFDDDSYVVEGWWEAMQGVMERKIDYFGHRYWIDYLPAQAAMLKALPWYTGVPFLSRNGRQGGQFMTGFLAVRAKPLRGTRLPDCREAWKWERYRHFGSDIVLGEMARQLNWTIALHAEGVHVRDELETRVPSPSGNGQQHLPEAERTTS
jgi:hypothetical protein